LPLVPEASSNRVSETRSVRRSDADAIQSSSGEQTPIQQR
jgi:hypothetical protein